MLVGRLVALKLLLFIYNRMHSLFPSCHHLRKRAHLELSQLLIIRTVNINHLQIISKHSKTYSVIAITVNLTSPNHPQTREEFKLNIFQSFHRNSLHSSRKLFN